MTRDTFSIDQRRTAQGIAAAWDDETLGGDLDTLAHRLCRASGIEYENAVKVIHAARFERRRG